MRTVRVVVEVIVRSRALVLLEEREGLRDELIRDRVHHLPEGRREKGGQRHGQAKGPLEAERPPLESERGLGGSGGRVREEEWDTRNRSRAVTSEYPKLRK